MCLTDAFLKDTHCQEEKSLKMAGWRLLQTFRSRSMSTHMGMVLIRCQVLKTGLLQCVDGLDEGMRE